MEEIDLKYVTIRYKEPIVYMVFKAGCELGFPQMQELVSCAEKLSDKKPYVVFSDAREYVGVTPEGRKYSSDIKNSPLQKGTAVLVKNNFYKLAADFFIGFQNPTFPYSVFTEEQKAIDWLLSLPLSDQISPQ